MSWTQIADNYWVSPQIDEAEVAVAAENGIEVIVCNRPDGESADQIPSETIKASAESKGLSFVYLPMVGPQFSEDDVAQVQQLNADKKKVLAYCRSGNRSSILYNAAVSA